MVGARIRDQRQSAAAPESAECAALAGVYRLLGRLLEEELDAATLELLRGELRGALVAAGIDPGADFWEAAPGQLLEELAEEYTALLVAPGACRPLASVALTGMMMQDPANRAERAYAQAGWAYRERLCGEFADHLGTMLCFVGELAAAEAAALEAGDGEAVSWRERRASFLMEELGPWAPGFCRRARAAALHPFYGAVLGAVEQLLWSELARLVDRRHLRDLRDENHREPPRLDYDADFRKASGL